jgi:histidine triad (HIT) family protein
MSESCVFCRIAKGEIPARLVHEDEEVVGFHDLNPQAPVHVLLIPRRHVGTLLETGPGDVELLGRLQAAAVEVARRLGLDREGFRLVTNCLEGAGQSVFHLHVHLLGGRPLGWPPG